jgi:hypothetical protein
MTSIKTVDGCCLVLLFEDYFDEITFALTGADHSQHGHLLEGSNALRSQAALSVMLALLLPVRARATGIAPSYNTAVTLFGGLLPLTLTALSRWFDSTLVPGFYLVTGGAVSLASVCSGTPRRTTVNRRAG